MIIGAIGEDIEKDYGDVNYALGTGEADRPYATTASAPGPKPEVTRGTSPGNRAQTMPKLQIWKL
jgi:hypothetical protein